MPLATRASKNPTAKKRSFVSFCKHEVQNSKSVLNDETISDKDFSVCHNTELELPLLCEILFFSLSVVHKSTPFPILPLFCSKKVSFWICPYVNLIKIALHSVLQLNEVGCKYMRVVTDLQFLQRIPMLMPLFTTRGQIVSKQK